jgi:hypothetical protein
VAKAYSCDQKLAIVKISFIVGPLLMNVGFLNSMFFICYSRSPEEESFCVLVIDDASI